MARHKKTRMATIEQWGPLRKHWLYQGRIRSVSVNGAPDHLRVEIVNLDPRELDRVHTVNLPLPAKPGNRTCALFVACGMDAKVGASIDLDQLVNRIVGFRLCDHANDGLEQLDFERFPNPPATVRPSIDGSVGKDKKADPDIPF